MANKTIPTPADPKTYVDAIESPLRQADARYLLKRMEEITGEAPKMWGPSIIGFGNYHYTYESGREGDFFAAGFAPRKSETVVYLVGSFPERDALLERLGKHRMGKSCLYIKRLDQVDLTILDQLIESSAQAIKAKWPPAG